MPIVAYKCTSCGAELKFDAESGKFVCEYCGSEFTKDELESNQTAPATETDVEKENSKGFNQDTDENSEALYYTCPNCGGEIITDSTTAATECYYCHSPVVLSGRLGGKFLPNRLVPFQFDRKTALDKFYEWTKKKFFLPKGFFSEKQIEKFTGVYFPYWIVDADTKTSFYADGDKVNTWTSGKTQYTNTKVYSLEREGDVHLEDIIKTGLKKANKRLVESVQPFDEQALIPFSMTYLSGFQAEKRDIERSEIEDDVNNDINNYSKEVIKETTSDYSSVRETSFNCTPTNVSWEYGLLPVWTMTYMYKNNLYYYAMNGQSGKICGKLPVDKKKLLLFAGGLSLLLCLILLLGGYFII